MTRTYHDNEGPISLNFPICAWCGSPHHSEPNCPRKVEGQPKSYFDDTNWKAETIGWILALATCLVILIVLQTLGVLDNIN